MVEENTMIQDIGRNTIDTEFAKPKPQDSDYVLIFEKNDVFVVPETGVCRHMPTGSGWAATTVNWYIFLSRQAPSSLQCSIRTMPSNSSCGARCRAICARYSRHGASRLRDRAAFVPVVSKPPLLRLLRCTDEAGRQGAGDALHQ